MTGASYLPLVPQLVLILGGMAVMLLEPFTAPGRKNRLGQIAIVATAVSAYSLKFQWTAHGSILYFGMFIQDG